MSKDTKKLLEDLIDELSDAEVVDYESVPEVNDEYDLPVEEEKVKEEEVIKPEVKRNFKDAIKGLNKLDPLPTFENEIEDMEEVKSGLEKAQEQAEEAAKTPEVAEEDEDPKVQLEKIRQKRYDKAVKLYESRDLDFDGENFSDYALSYASCLSNLPVDRVKELVKAKRNERGNK